MDLGRDIFQESIICLRQDEKEWATNLLENIKRFCCSQQYIQYVCMYMQGFFEFIKAFDAIYNGIHEMKFKRTLWTVESNLPRPSSQKTLIKLIYPLELKLNFPFGRVFLLQHYFEIALIIEYLETAKTANFLLHTKKRLTGLFHSILYEILSPPP